MGVDWGAVDAFVENNRGLIAALTAVESGGDVFASRFEPHYSYLWDVVADGPKRCDDVYRPNDFEGVAGVTSMHTEFTQQRTSWGPLQVMGAVAREYGYRGSFAALCGELGVRFGCWHLIALKRRLAAKGLNGVDDLIAAYNAGWARRDADSGEYLNQRYVDKVNAALLVAG